MSEDTAGGAGVAASQIATIAVSLVALALAVGARSLVVAGVALTGFLTLAGLWLLRESTARRLTAGSTLTALAVLFGSAGVALAASTGAHWRWLTAASVWLVVVCGAGASQVGTDWTEQWRSIATLGIGSAGLLLSGLVLSISDAGVAATIAFGRRLLALTGEPVSLAAFGALLTLVFGAIAVGLKLLPDVTLVGTDATSEDVEAITDASFAALVLLLCSLFGTVLLAYLPLPTTQSKPIQAVTTYTPLRVLLLAVLLGGPLAGLCGLALRWSWQMDEETLLDRGVVVFAGVLVTVGGLVGALVGMPGRGPPIGLAGAADRAFVLGGLAVVTAVLAVLSRLVFVALLPGRDRTDGIVLGGFAGAVAVSVGTDAILAPIVAVGATLVAWDVATHGRGLVDSLGGAAPTADAEFVHASGSLVVALAGVVVATIVTYLLPFVGPALVSAVSVPGLALGALLIVVGAAFATMETETD